MLELKKHEEHWWKRLPIVEGAAVILAIGIIVIIGVRMAHTPPSDPASANAGPSMTEQAGLVPRTCPDTEHLTKAWEIIAELRRDRDLLIAAVPPPKLALIDECVSHPERDTCRLACLVGTHNEIGEDVSRVCTRNVVQAVHTHPGNCPDCI